MPVPLGVAIPAAAASLAYLNAKSSFSYDVHMRRIQLTIMARALWRIFRSRLNLFHQLEAQAKDSRVSQRDLLRFEGKSFTYADVYDKALRYGTWLKEAHGIRKGDIVAMNFQNSEQFVFLWWGLWSIGAKPAFINYNLTGRSLAHSIREATTGLCIVDPRVAESVTKEVRQELSGVQFVTLTPELEAEVLAHEPKRVPDEDLAENDPTALAILIYTSGTTGLPKAAIVSWGKVIGGGSNGSVICSLKPDDVMYTSMPLYHSAASILSFTATVFAGSTQALGRKFSTKSFWSDCRATKATHAQYVGETLRYLLAAPPEVDPATGRNLDKDHSVRIVFGNGLRPDIWQRFKDRFGIDTVAEIYAATECPFSLVNVSSNDLSLGAIGRLGWAERLLRKRYLAFVKVDWETETPLRDPNTGFCVRTASKEPGEMLFRLEPEDINRMFQGYYNNSKATSGKVMRGVFQEGDAYYCSGDVCSWDFDSGLIHFFDRVGDTFRWKSENVSTSEVSEALGSHADVVEANVYGVSLPHHDGRAGCVALAMREAGDGKSGGGILPRETLRSLAGHVDAALPPYARPLFLRIMAGGAGAQGQTTGTNKQQKTRLRQLGVQPGVAEEEVGRVFWRKGGEYVEFGKGDWEALQGGRVRL